MDNVRVLDFIWPADGIALGVVFFLFVVFGAWVISLTVMRLRLRREATVLRAFRDVSALSDDLNKEEENSDDTNPHARSFEAFLRKKQISSSSPIAEHVETIYNVGRTGGRLDVNDLTNHTVSKLFGANRLLRSVLGLFIVIGLLGTLIELAHSLSVFAMAEQADDMRGVLHDVLATLRTALAPSIWGVFLTVVGVFTFSWHVSSRCDGLKNEVEGLTLRTWMPELYPTTTQRTVETLEEAERQLHENMDAARDVAQFADDINEDLRDFDQKLGFASDVLGKFSAAMSTVDSASERFSTAMDEISSSQEDVSQLVEASQERAENIQQLIENLGQQNQKIEERLQRLADFEEERRVQGRKTQEEFTKTMGAAERALESVASRNDDVLATLGTPLVEQLEEVQEGLDKVEKTMHERLGKLREGVDRLSDPVASSAEQIERIAHTFSASVEALMKDVQSEFYRQNEELSTRADELQQLNKYLGDLVQNQNELITTVKSLNGSVHHRSLWTRLKQVFKFGA